MQSIIRQMESPPLVEWIMLDFEAASWQAMRDVLPGRVIKGCVFHWNQRVYRKIMNEGLGTAYIQKGDIYLFLRKLMSLPYLPIEHISPAFHSLKAQAEAAGGPLVNVCAYIDHTWIDGRVWRPENWSVFRQTVRTNNDVEGWHRRINEKGGRPDLPFYVMVPLLRREANTVDLQVRLVSEQLLTRCHRKKYAQLHSRLFDAWDRYEDDEMTTTQLLRVCSQIGGVVPTRDPIHEEEAF